MVVAKSKQFRVLLDDGMQIPRGTGIGKYSEHLGRALDAVDGVSVDYLGYEQKGNRQSARLAYLRYINSKEFVELADSYDLCIFTNYAMPRKRLTAKTAVTIHDLAVYDCPDTLPRLYLPYGRAMIRNSMRHADKIVTVSQTMAKAIKNRFPKQAGKVTYAWPGVYDHVRAGEHGAPYEDQSLARASAAPFFLMVGTVEKRKNVEFVIEAFSEFRKHGKQNVGYKLILAGRPGFGFEDIQHCAQNSGFERDIVFTGYVSDDDCANLYRDALALVFPSIYEGFGSIQNECMAMGLPIILSDIPTNREVSRDYGVYFRLNSHESLSQAMEQIASGLIDADAISNLGAKYLPRFSWAKVASKYLLNAIN
jgi:glycosyltransferase involved in cell wall biosynthesis